MTTRTPSGAAMPTLYPGLDDTEQTPFEHPSDAERRTDWSDHPLWPRDESRGEPDARRAAQRIVAWLKLGLLMWAGAAIALWLAL